MGSRILVVEDDEPIRRGLVAALGFGGHQVTEAAEAEGVVNRARQDPPDLALLDLMLPGQDGFWLLGELRRAFPRLPLIILSARGAEDDRVRGLQLGADDYVVKPFSARELLARVDAVLRRTGERTPLVRWLQVGERLVDLERRELNIDGRVLQLTDRETELLRFLASHEGRAVSRSELLSQLWGCDASNITSRSVDMAVARLREKLEEDAAEPAFIVTVRGHGYSLGRDVEART
ncbi:MAG: response regulator transcription factor [Acidobacteriota bacterium]